MKLLTIMAALLISFSAFSQDYIEYRDFKFYQNGSEISFEEVTELTKEYGVARAAFRQGRRDFEASQNVSRARGRNLIGETLAFSSSVGAIGGFTFGWIQMNGGLFGDSEFHPASYITLYTLGVISTGAMIYSGNLMGTKETFKKRADRKFSKTAQKLNEAVQLGNSQ